MTVLRVERGTETHQRGPWGKYRKALRIGRKLAAKRCEQVRYGMDGRGNAVFFTGGAPAGVRPLVGFAPPRRCSADLTGVTCDAASVRDMRARIASEMLRRRHALDRQTEARTTSERREAAAVVRGTRAAIDRMHTAVEACVRGQR